VEGIHLESLNFDIFLFSLTRFEYIPVAANVAGGSRKVGFNGFSTTDVAPRWFRMIEMTYLI
jgi:hypothetical protein